MLISWTITLINSQTHLRIISRNCATTFSTALWATWTYKFISLIYPTDESHAAITETIHVIKSKCHAHTKGMSLFTWQCPHSQLTAHQHTRFRSLQPLCANISKELTNNYTQGEFLYFRDKTELTICPRNPHPTELQSQLLTYASCCSCWFLCMYHTFHVAHYMWTLYMWNEPTNIGSKSWSVYTYESGNVCMLM